MDSKRFDPIFKMETPLLFAHRGGACEVPESTQEAFNHAIMLLKDFLKEYREKPLNIELKSSFTKESKERHDQSRSASNKGYQKTLHYESYSLPNNHATLACRGYQIGDGLGIKIAMEVSIITGDEIVFEVQKSKVALGKRPDSVRNFRI